MVRILILHGIIITTSSMYVHSACVGSLDPHCVWSDAALQCVQSPLSAIGSSPGTVDSTLWVVY